MKKRVGIVGTGYVGLVHGVILSDFGLQVTCMDVDNKKISKLNDGIPPIYEPGLEKMLKINLDQGRIQFTSDMKETVENSDIIFIAVGTPSSEDGSADLHYVKEVAKSIGQYINGDKVIVNKSTVPVGSGKMVEQIIEAEMKNRKVDYKIAVISNPEFLREGQAVRDSLSPDRIVLGSDDPNWGLDAMLDIYECFAEKNIKFLCTNLETAEMIKYASNAFLAVKISFINEMALLADKVGADIEAISQGMGMDERISPKFLKAGCGYGGSCFPKDTKAIVNIGNQHDEDMMVIKAAIDANEKQKQKIVEKICDVLSSEKESFNGLLIAVWGLSFKPDTDDMRDAPSIDIIKGLVNRGAIIKAYCPGGMNEAKVKLRDIDKAITYCKDEFDALKGAEALVLITEWNQFRGVPLDTMKTLMKGDIVFDLRNIFYKNKRIRDEFKYYGLGCK